MNIKSGREKKGIIVIMKEMDIETIGLAGMIETKGMEEEMEEEMEEDMEEEISSETEMTAIEGNGTMKIEIEILIIGGMMMIDNNKNSLKDLDKKIMEATKRTLIT